LTARLRSVAMFAGPCPVRIWEASSAKVVSLMWWIAGRCNFGARVAQEG
jgi:hypothetical protein